MRIHGPPREQEEQRIIAYADAFASAGDGQSVRLKRRYRCAWEDWRRDVASRRRRKCCCGWREALLGVGTRSPHREASPVSSMWARNHGVSTST